MGVTTVMTHPNRLYNISKIYYCWFIESRDGEDEDADNNQNPIINNKPLYGVVLMKSRGLNNAFSDFIFSAFLPDQYHPQAVDEEPEAQQDEEPFSRCIQWL